LSNLGQKERIPHHLVWSRIRLRLPTIKNAGVFRSTSNIKMRYAFMLPVSLEDVIEDAVGNEVGWVLHQIELKGELGQNQ
jgi:hypothetical protein